MFHPQFTRLSLLAATSVALLGSCNRAETPGLTSSRSSSGKDQPVSTVNSVVRRNQHYILLLKTNQLPASLYEDAWQANGTVTSVLPGAGVILVTSNDPDFKEKARQITGVRAVVHDFTYRATAFSRKLSDARRATAALAASPGLLPLQWTNPGQTNASRGSLVAVLDEGFDLSHPSRKTAIIAHKSFVPEEPAPAGASVTADIEDPAADRLLLLKVSRNDGAGSFGSLMEGLYYATDQRADVVNLRLDTTLPREGRYRDDNGTPNDTSDDKWVTDNADIQGLLEAVGRVTTYAAENGVAIIAATNTSPSLAGSGRMIRIPADLPHVTAVQPIEANTILTASR